MIHKVDDHYVISSRGCWLPGNYDSESTARWAFRFPNEVLYRLEDDINQQQQRPTTRDDLAAAKAN